MNTMNDRDNEGRSGWIAAGIAILLLLGWEMAAAMSDAVKFLVSSPREVGRALLAMAVSEALLADIGVTAAEALLGTCVGTVLGSAVGLALWLSKPAARVAAPFIVVGANFPVFALAPAAIVWLGIGLGMKVFLAALATFFVSLSLAHRGAQIAHKQFGGAFDGFQASRWDSYHKLIVPGALDSVFSSMRVNVGLGILGAFIGEFIASEQGLGRVIMRASGLYQIDRVFAASACIVALAALFDWLAKGLEREKLLISRLFGLPTPLRKRKRELSDRQRDASGGRSSGIGGIG